MKTLVSLLLTLALSCLWPAYADAFSEANQLSAAGSYEQADKAYQTLLEQQGPSAPLLFNIGTNAFAQKQYGSAILYFERAQVFSPRDSDIKKNLRLARKEAQVEDVILLNRSVAPLALFLSRDEWSVVIIVFAWAAALITCAACFLRKSWKRVLVWCLCTIVVSACMIALAATMLHLRRSEDHLAIVVAKDSSLLLSPFAGADPITSAAEGSMVSIEQTRDNFYYVHIPDTELSGWLETSKCQPIIKVR